jgi:hypothetical protein
MQKQKKVVDKNILDDRSFGINGLIGHWDDIRNFRSQEGHDPIQIGKIQESGCQLWRHTLLENRTVLSRITIIINNI